MSSAAKEILESALKLEPDERERLAEALWQSLGNLASVEAAWADEIQRRIIAADSGQSDSTLWEEARDELLGELKQIHPRGR
jgi:putative addiction module component (TIGR02574 family)